MHMHVHSVAENANLQILEALKAGTPLPLAHQENLLVQVQTERQERECIRRKVGW